MSRVPTHVEILVAAASITVALEHRMLHPHEMSPEDFYRHGPWAEWMRHVPDRLEVRLQEPHAIEHAIVFLEADPWCHRSGYEKQWILRALAHADLSPTQLLRIEAALLHLLRLDRREVTDAFYFVRHRRSPAMKPALRSLLMDHDNEVAAKALRALLAARRPRLGTVERERVRELLRRGAFDLLGMSGDEHRRAIEVSRAPAASH